MRLQQYLAQCGLSSRRKSEDLIRAGRVSVNGCVVTEMGVTVKEGDRVCFDGETVFPAEEKVYILLNKPPYVMTTHADPQGRKTVYAYVADVPARLFAVGRLDYDTEGALLLTNDGVWANTVMHPRYNVQKRYLAQIRGRLTQGEIRALCQGVVLDDGFVTSPALVHQRPGDANAWVELTIHEGQNRQIRRMLHAVGHEVFYLKREAIGTLELGGLEAGQWRYLTETEKRSLMAEPAQK